MHFSRRSYLAVLSLPSLPPCGCGPSVTTSSFTAKKKVSELAVQVVLQDRAGFLWVGTQNGLFRYDGSHFTAFGAPRSAGRGRIESLHEAVKTERCGSAHHGSGAAQGETISKRWRWVWQTRVVGTGGDRVGFATGTSTWRRNGARGRNETIQKGWEFRLAEPAPGHPAGEPADAVYVDSTGMVWYGCGSADLCRLQGA